MQISDAEPSFPCYKYGIFSSSLTAFGCFFKTHGLTGAVLLIYDLSKAQDSENFRTARLSG